MKYIPELGLYIVNNKEEVKQAFEDWHYNSEEYCKGIDTFKEEDFPCVIRFVNGDWDDPFISVRKHPVNKFIKDITSGDSIHEKHKYEQQEEVVTFLHRHYSPSGVVVTSSKG